jgi:hypothetical protein
MNIHQPRTMQILITDYKLRIALTEVSTLLEHSSLLEERQVKSSGTFRFLKSYVKEIDRLCGLVVRVPGYTTEMYCVSCKVRTEFIYVM